MKTKKQWIILTVYFAFILLPIYWLLNMSFKTNEEILGTLTLFPNDFTLRIHAQLIYSTSRRNQIIPFSVKICYLY